MYVESFHRTLKYIEVLLNLAKYKAFQYYLFTSLHIHLHLAMKHSTKLKTYWKELCECENYICTLTTSS